MGSPEVSTVTLVLSPGDRFPPCSDKMLIIALLPFLQKEKARAKEVELIVKHQAEVLGPIPTKFKSNQVPSPKERFGISEVLNGRKSFFSCLTYCTIQGCTII